MKSIIENLIKENKTIKEIAETLNLSHTGTRYWIKKFGLKTNKSDNNISKKWSKENLEKLILESGTKSEVIKKLDLKIRAGNYKTLDKYINIYNLDISHFDRYMHSNRFNSRKLTNEEIFKENTNYSHIKSRIINDKLLEYKCQECENNGLWNNIKLVLQLDHINGNNLDNRLENLRFLCPNCHSQTKTFCKGKLAKRVYAED